MFINVQNIGVYIQNLLYVIRQPINAIKSQYDSQGFAVVHNIIDSNNLCVYQNMYDAMLNNEIDATKHRHDLGNNEEKHLKNIENITQIMWFVTIYLQTLFIDQINIIIIQANRIYYKFTN